MTRPRFIDDISADVARAALSYDPGTGQLTRLTGCSAGAPAGFFRGTGYIGVSVRNRTYPAHRIAWLITYGHWPTGEIDHIDGDKANNRLANLRDVPKSINGHNRPVRRGSASGVKGVSPKKGRWVAQICVDGVRHRLGSFTTKEAAGEAYRLAAARHLPPCPRAG